MIEIRARYDQGIFSVYKSWLRGNQKNNKETNHSRVEEGKKRMYVRGGKIHGQEYTKGRGITETCYTG